MTLGPLVQGIVFAVFACIAVAGALGMATTMSMFRSGIFLMASFIGVAGFSILLSADLPGLLQGMMYIGGMLVMILFMVLFSHDPGGAMMAGMMELSLLERLFSHGLAADHGGHTHHQSHEHHNAHADDMPHDPAGAPGQGAEADAEAGGEPEHGHMDMGGMDMQDMAMTTPIRRLAAVLAIFTGLLLVALLLWRPVWPVTTSTPAPQSAHLVGTLLMGKYMIAFEGAGLLILIGIFGAVLLSRPGSYPDARARGVGVAVKAPPAPIAPEPLAPLMPPDSRDRLAPLTVIEAHQDDGEQGTAR